ncbi:bacteriocin [Mammaliicoccus sciuri]|uniref:bacteriocin n=1 Tax=Mammaliicoccus sciuri TaxID=1296 RepID=UPI000E693401|nr:bacteriocin [Mammaliicoccus sciuri]RIN82674.1 bacteriocin [Mammaliicoccus sciuri]
MNMRKLSIKELEKISGGKTARIWYHSGVFSGKWVKSQGQIALKRPAAYAVHT